MNKERINKLLSKVPTHAIIIFTILIWVVPTLGLLVASLRPVQDTNTTGWWTVLSAPPGVETYQTFCASCHGWEGNEIPTADLSDPELVSEYPRSLPLLAALRKEINGQPHMGGTPLPDSQQAADIAVFLKRLSGSGTTSRFTVDNYIDALVGYRGLRSYRLDCSENLVPVGLSCDLATDLLNPRGMGRAFVNSLIVTIPATILPILFAAFAGYAIYLMRNFLGSLPSDVFESAYLDGASHWTAFYKLAIPLALPAIASLAIFQFLWVWNDLLVSLVFLGGTTPVMTYQISNMVTSLGAGWHLLTAAAFLSLILPMIVFFSLQRYFVRGMLSGAVKG